MSASIVSVSLSLSGVGTVSVSIESVRVESRQSEEFNNFGCSMSMSVGSVSLAAVKL